MSRGSPSLTTGWRNGETHKSPPPQLAPAHDVLTNDKESTVKFSHDAGVGAGVLCLIYKDRL